MANIDPAIAGLVLEAVSDDDFEIFSQALLIQIIGLELEPTGGMHDGGQDGFFRPVKGRPTHFIQISTQPDVKAKILKTIKRQRDVGRNVEELTYVSNRSLPNRDILEGDIEKETGVGIRIRDRRWITTQTQRDDKASQIFVDRFAPLVHSALRLNGHRTQVYTPSERMSILSYMEVHSASEPNESDLLTLAVDSAVYLALEGTDPDKAIFRSEDQIRTFVEERFPASKKRSVLDVAKRLSRLSSKPACHVFATIPKKMVIACLMKFVPILAIIASYYATLRSRSGTEFGPVPRSQANLRVKRSKPLPK